MKKTFGNSRGQIAVLYAGIAAVLLGAVALGADVAVMYANWTQAQKTADAAAIAGANFTTGLTYPSGAVNSNCTGEPDDASKAACTYVANNGLAVDANSLTITEPPPSNLKVVVKESGLPYFFGQALGLNTYNITATATAQGPGNIGTVPNGMFPIGLQCGSATTACSLSSLDPGQSVSFGAKFVGGLASGNWQWLDLSGGNSSNGTSTLISAIQNGATGSYSINPPNNTVPQEPGNAGQNTNVAAAVSSRLASCDTSIADPCSGGNPHDIPAGDPCLVVVPAGNFAGNNGRSIDLTIDGFALIYLEQNSTSTSIQGCLVQTVKTGTIPDSKAPNLGGLVVDALIQ